MIVSCPNCAVRFEVPQSALGTAGRKVKCSSCAHVWLQRPDGGTAPLPAVPPAPQAAPAAATAATEQATAEPEPDEAPGEAPAEAAPRRRRFGRNAAASAAGPRRSGKRKVAIAAVLLLAVAGIAGGAFWLQRGEHGGESVVGRLMAMLSGKPDLPGQGLNFEKVETKRRVDAGVTVLVVTGEVVNTTAVVRPIPPLKGSLLGPNSKELQSWTFSASAERLEAGQRAKFETLLRQPSTEATDIKVTFAVPGG